MHLYFSVFCFSCLLIFNSINVVAQSASASTKEKEYLIGDWIPVDLFVSSTANNRVAFPNLKDSISETIEVANFTPIDTIKNGNQFEYHQLVNLVVFDTGKIVLPQFQFVVENKGTLDTITSEPILVHVAGVKIDTTKDIKDIKEPLKIPYTFKEVMPYIIGALLLTILIGGLVWYFMYYRKKKQKPIDEKYTLPPHVWAFKELDKLQQKKLWQGGEIKNYYSELTDIARTYIELRYKIPAMEKTTDELMSSMHKGILKQSLKTELNEVLMLSDFVKFAKAQPDFMDNENALKIIKDFIEKTKLIEAEKIDKNKHA
ncbi:MAG TPA: hypothetical protein PLJ42_08475 [Chitinophagales bacterium]|nr:hypothetical protein [Chitinophagales bacterium]MBP6154230.1 hypothetical protein [Chitinophagales bacterium]HQV78304.1 hypothetical protein [Chitinophagales bacterium]HQW79455.1 hypothetical protein [Chitinophagales bacterium]HRB66887.1 hypothetical protein [Chitinophagales bacterium]